MNLEKCAQDVFDSQPFSQLVGAELSKVGTDSAEIAVPITDHLKQQHGYVHGGLISYVADNSITFAGGLALGGNALTSEFKINYVAPAVGQSLVGRAVAKVLANGRRSASARFTQSTVSGRPCARSRRARWFRRHEPDRLQARPTFHAHPPRCLRSGG